MLLDKKIEPPWKPNLVDRMDLRNIDPEFTQENISCSVYDSSSITNNNPTDTTFSGFSYVPDHNLNNFSNFTSTES